MKLRKMWMGIGTISLLTGSIIFAASCKTNDFYTNTDISGLNNYFNNGEEKNKKLIEEVENIRKGTNDKAKELLNQKVIQITTGGKVNDKSFNQSVWEAISKFSTEIGIDDSRYYETTAISQAVQNDAYDFAMAKDFNIWVLTGFQQAELLSNWLKLGNNQKRFDEKKIKIITIDWYDEKLASEGRLLGLNFRTQESSFVVAYAAAKLISELYKGNENINKRYFNTFGGGDFSGVTNFNYGFYEGLRIWNKEQTSNDTKVLATPIDLTTGFSLTTDSRSKVYNAVDGGKDNPAPSVIMPVAGSLTATAIDRVKEKDLGYQWVIGVDTDMSLTYPKDKQYLLTSAEKRIGVAAYKGLVSLFGLSNYDKALMDSFFSDEIHINEDGLIVDKNKKPTNINIEGGYAKGFVNVSNSTIANIEHAKKFDQYAKEAKEKFFGINGNDGEFSKEKPPSLEEMSKPEWQYKINNPQYGYMTANNLNNYFIPAINEINSWKNSFKLFVIKI